MSTAAPPPSTIDLATGPGEPDGDRTRSVAPWVTAGVAVAVTALVAGGLALGGRGPLAAVAGSGPDVLHIGTGFTGGGNADTVADAKGLRAGRYVLTGTLPGTPDRGTAWWLTKGSVDASQVAALATALGMSGAPQRDGHDWVVRDGAAILRVYDQPGVPFAFDASQADSLCPSMPTDGFGGPDTAVGCVMTAPAPSTATPPAPDDATLRDQARSILAALASDASVMVWRAAPYGGATLDPTVDGVPTSGAGISLQATTDGVMAASGWLGGFLGSTVDQGDTYPLRTAKDVFGDFASMPEPAMACAEPTDGSPACGGDVEVTGASYGLTLAFDDGRPVLVPAWLFATSGSDTPFARVAVEPRYLGDATGSGSGSGSSGGSSGSTEPGAGTNPTTGTEPAPPPDLPTDGGPTVGSADPRASDLPLDVDPAVDPIREPGSGTATPAGPLVPGATVTVVNPRLLLLNVSAGCELQTAEAAAKETATAVVLTYTFLPLPCPSGRTGTSVHASLKIALDSDLAGRTVVDEAGSVIPVATAG